MDKKAIIKLTNSFNAIAQQVSDGTTEFWYARDLMEKLGYVKWQNFGEIIVKAKKACENSNVPVVNHFTDVSKMVSIGSGAERLIDDVMLTRYACYLIAQNGDPSKPVIANGQTYFAIQTRCQELADDEAFQHFKEGEKRLFLRNEMKEHTPEATIGKFRIVQMDGRHA